MKVSEQAPQLDAGDIELLKKVAPKMSRMFFASSKWQKAEAEVIAA